VFDARMLFAVAIWYAGRLASHVSDKSEGMTTRKTVDVNIIIRTPAR
jgi:hypothetical protein